MNKKELDDTLAMSLEERQALQQKIIEEMDDDCERELDERNRARASIAPDDYSLKIHKENKT